MVDVPSNLIPTRITQLPVAPVADEDSLMMIVYQGNNYQIRVGDLLSVAGVPTSRQVIAGTGLQGGGQLSSNVTLSIASGGVGSVQLANSGVTPGIYGTATDIPVFTVDITGRVTAATSIPATITGYVPDNRQVIAGTGLNGGGALSANVTLNANLSNSAPQAGFQAGVAGVSTDIARIDHQHPAVDLSDDDQVDNILGLSNGGTAKSIVPDEGAMIWCGADGLYVGPVGAAGQMLQSNGVGEYLWVNQSTLNVGQADNLNGGATNRIPYQLSTNTTDFVTAPVAADTFLSWDGAAFAWASLSGAGTVTSVNASGGTTGMTFSGGPVTSSGTLTLAGTLAAVNGGTAQTTYVTGDVLYSSGSNTLSKLAIGTSGQVLKVTAGVPAWETDATTGTVTSVGLSAPAFLTVGGSPVTSSGTLALTFSGTAIPAVNGGTAQTTYSTGDLLYASGANTLAKLSIGTSAQVLKVTAGVPAWETDTTTGTVTSVAQSFTGGLISVSGSPITSSGTLALTVAGTSGGVPYFSAASTWASSAELTQYGVIYGGGAGASPVATAAGTTGQVLTATTSGAPSWASPATSGTVTSVAVSGGTTGLTTSGGPVTSSGTITLAGTLTAVNGGTAQTTYAAGDIVYASATNTLSKLTVGSTGQVLTVAAGVPSWATDTTTGTVTSVAQSFTGGLISVSGSPVTSSGTLALTVAGTSGGIPYFSSASTWATSAALTQYGVVYGGGAGASPVATANGTSGQVLIATTSGAPSWSGISGGTF